MSVNKRKGSFWQQDDDSHGGDIARSMDDLPIGIN
jgi:hypothetical protein